jgi:DNA-binding NarL/FixJ family response regulator
MTRGGLCQLVEQEADLTVCGQAGSAAAAFEAIRTDKPDLVLTDFKLPDKSGLELIKDIRVLYPTLPMLVLSMHDERFYAERVLQAGARGYVMKLEAGETIAEAIRQVLDGGLYVSPSMSRKVLELYSGDKSGRSPLEDLTDREFEVFELIGQGKEPNEIADYLHLSPRTVEVHRTHIRERLKIHSNTELIAFAARWLAESK